MSSTDNDAAPARDTGHHEIQRGATAYSAVVGAFGALAVPAIVLIFQSPDKSPRGPTLDTYAIGLLVTGMFGCLLGAIALAYIGAERDPIASLAPAIIYAAVPVSVSVCSILAAFEVLSALSLPSAKTLFALVVAAGGLFGVIYSSFAVLHSVTLGPTQKHVRSEWQERQALRSRSSAERAAFALGVASSLPVLLATALRLADIHMRPTQIAIRVVMGIAFALILVGPLLAVLRTRPSDTPAKQKAIRLVEAYAPNVAVGGYVLLLLIALP
jgi:hypothetical protein